MIRSQQDCKELSGAHIQGRRNKFGILLLELADGLRGSVQLVEEVLWALQKLGVVACS